MTLELKSTIDSWLPPSDNTEISQDKLNIEEKERSNLFPWKGQFSPQLVEVLLKTYGSKTSFILDPFMGSGTVLYESGFLGLRALGLEINPAACKIAQIYTLINLGQLDRNNILKSLEKRLNKIFQYDLPLFNYHSPTNSHQDCFPLLIDIYSRLSEGYEKLILESLITLLDKKNNASIEPARILHRWFQLRDKIKSLPYSSQIIDCANCDSRSIPLASDQIDLVITSPPYINVFNYHQQYRSSMEAMGWNLLDIAKSEIGSNRKHRSNRFLTVIQYILDMNDVFHELRRVIKKKALIIFVVGRESKIKKTAFYNSAIIGKLATECCGFTLKKRQERVFKNRFGQNIYEDLLYFEVRDKETINNEELAFRIAEDTLIKAQNDAPEESLKDLDDALSKIKYVQKSPIYKIQDSSVKKYE